MARVVLLTGGNSGDVKRTLQAAQQLVNAKVGAVLRCSHRYETKPWGFDADGVFSNQALEVSTDLLPLEVLDAVQAIERELGRNRAAERLTVPHPLMGEREFALVPLCEIMRQRRHPVTGRTVGEMLEELRNK